MLELQGASGQRLTANRDSLRYPHSTHLRDLITQMSVDRRSALKREKPVYTRFAGPKLHRPEKAGGRRERALDNPVVERVTAARMNRADSGGGIAVEPRGARGAEHSGARVHRQKLRATVPAARIRS